MVLKQDHGAPAAQRLETPKRMLSVDETEQGEMFGRLSRSALRCGFGETLKRSSVGFQVLMAALILELKGGGAAKL